MALPIFKWVSELADPLVKLIDNVHTSQEEKDAAKERLERIKQTISLREADTVDKLIEVRSQVILAEARGGVLQRTWRPVLMYAIILILVNNYLVAPYLAPHFPNYVIMLELPDQLWTLLTIGMGGYVVGRSAENVAGKLKANKLKGGE